MKKTYDTETDKNFDDLSHHFRHKIYKQQKGRIRLAVLERDLTPYLSPTMQIVDAGGGQGQMAIKLAARGHRVTLCDISREMLALAKEEADRTNLGNIAFLHCPLQKLASRIESPVDLVLCHAVLEWLAEPEHALQSLGPCIKKGGFLSLAFFNRNAIIFKNLLRGNYRKVMSGDFVGQEGSLTPLRPLTMEQVSTWCSEAGFEILEHSGIRVFHDYIADPKARARAPEDALQLELMFSRQEPFRSLGRYIHFIARKT